MSKGANIWNRINNVWREIVDSATIALNLTPGEASFSVKPGPLSISEDTEAAIVRCGLAVWQAYGLDLTVYDEFDSNAAPTTGSIYFIATRYAFGVAYNQANSTATWAGLNSLKVISLQPT